MSGPVYSVQSMAGVNLLILGPLIEWTLRRKDSTWNLLLLRITHGLDTEDGCWNHPSTGAKNCSYRLHLVAFLIKKRP